MTFPSMLRLLGILSALAGIGMLWRRRSERLLGRWELLLLFALSFLALLAAFPVLGNALLTLTGFHGELGRITSVLAFSVLFLTVALAQLQSQQAELHFKFHDLLKNIAVERGLREVGWLEAKALGEGDEPVQEAPSLAIIMPAFNEADNLRELLPRAPARVLGLSTRVFVVDDGSTDQTVAVARAQGALVLRNPVNAGGGHALKVGFLAARRWGVRYVVTMDADGQHRFEDLATLMAPLVNNQADVVIGSRHLGESVGHEAVRAIGLRIFNGVLSFLVGWKVTDCSSGYRAFDMTQFDRLKLIQQRHHTAELIIEATRRKLRIVEVPITILPRVHGESKKGTTLLYGLRFAATILSAWWRQ